MPELATSGQARATICDAGRLCVGRVLTGRCRGPSWPRPRVR
jgi:hypothetical protein